MLLWCTQRFHTHTHARTHTNIHAHVHVHVYTHSHIYAQTRRTCGRATIVFPAHIFSLKWGPYLDNLLQLASAKAKDQRQLFVPLHPPSLSPSLSHSFLENNTTNDTESTILQSREYFTFSPYSTSHNTSYTLV